MTEPFDPYHDLLGIAPEERPPNHYRLLGINLFEAKRQVIVNAALQRSKFLRSLNVSQYGEVCQKLLNDVAEAKLCLLDDEARAEYDAQLRAQTASAAKPAAATSLPEADATASEIELAAGGPTPSEAAEPQVLRNSVRELPRRKTGMAATTRQWIVGRADKCDLVISAPAVSAVHCRLVRTKDGRYYLEDLASTNGTYLNRVPIAGKVVVTRYDSITLGKTTPMPWPDDADAE